MVVKLYPSCSLEMEWLVAIRPQELITQLPGQFGHGQFPLPPPVRINHPKSATPLREKIPNGFRYASPLDLGSLADLHLFF